VSDNQALGAPGSGAPGGGVFNQGGAVTVTLSTVGDNVVVGGLRLDANLTPGQGGGIANDAATFPVFGFAIFDVLAPLGGPGGRGAQFGAADFALAQVGLDLVAWTRPSKVVPSPGELAPRGELRR
jgi:hypothetical protein